LTTEEPIAPPAEIKIAKKITNHSPFPMSFI
jgi:hypothetical protein